MFDIHLQFPGCSYDFIQSPHEMIFGKKARTWMDEKKQIGKTED